MNGHDCGHEFVSESESEADLGHKIFWDSGHGLGHGHEQSHDFGHGYVGKPRSRTYFGHACPLISDCNVQDSIFLIKKILTEVGFEPTPPKRLEP